MINQAFYHPLKWSSREFSSFFLVSLFFVVPISSTAKSIFGALTLGSIVFSADAWPALKEMFNRPWSRAAFLLFCIAAVGCFWSPASFSEKLNAVEKYSKLLYLPILAVGLRDEKIRLMAMRAFLLAMLLTSSLSILKYAQVIQDPRLLEDFVFRNHIMTGMMMSFAAYLCGFFYFRKKGIGRLVYVALALIFMFQIFFVSIGRTGYLICLLLMLLLIVQHCSLKQTLIGIFAVLGLFLWTWYLNPTMQSGMNRMVTEYSHFKDNKNTSVGYRLQFHDYARNLFNRHPVLGNGTASFRSLFKTENPLPLWPENLLEPHSQYWLVAAEWGVLGLAALFLFFGSLFRECFRMPSLGPIALASLLIFCVGNVTDSLLFYSGSGYFFILFMALCLGEIPASTRVREKHHA